MERIMFTKPFKGKELELTLETVRGFGFDGLDFTVRPGYPVNPDNAEKELPRAAEIARQMGLSMPLVTPDRAVEADERTERLWAAAAEAGAAFLKIGYWAFGEGEDYWSGVEKIRRDLEGLCRLAEKYGVRAAFHQHSGLDYGCNCAAAMDILGGFDPQHVCLYMDPGHLSVDGESLPMAFSIIKGYLGLMAVKNPRYTPEEAEDHTRWRLDWNTPLAEGLVDWEQVLSLAGEHGFAGPIDLHSEYDLPLDTVIEWTRRDLKYIDGLLEQVGL